MSTPKSSEAASLSEAQLKLLICPATGEALRLEGAFLVSESGARRYPIHPSGILQFIDAGISEDAQLQQAHYDRVSGDYIANLRYPHTEEYHAYLDAALIALSEGATLATAAEVCCGRGEAFALLGHKMETGVGVDVSLRMLEFARGHHADARFLFAQGEAASLPLAADSFDAVFTLGGIHHVNDRLRLFSEVHRILKPGGRFFWREPVNDFFLWRWLRALIYKVSSRLDEDTERPLRRAETLSALRAAGLRLMAWKTFGFLGFCLFMNSDVLIFNRVFRFVPGIRPITRAAAWLDGLTVRLPGLRGAGLQVIGCAEKPTGDAPDP